MLSLAEDFTVVLNNCLKQTLLYFRWRKRKETGIEVLVFSVSLAHAALAAVCSCFMFQLNGKDNLYTGRKSSLNRDISNKDVICLLIKSMAENDSTIFATRCDWLTIFQFLNLASLFISIFFVLAIMSCLSK